MTVPAITEGSRDRALAALSQLPPFSPILNRLIASLALEDVSFYKVADLIEKDTVLAGNVLSLVNSALFGLRGKVNSIRHAVALLGINKLRNAMLSMSVARMWRHVKAPRGFSIAEFNLHSVAVAFLSDVLAQRLEVPYAEGAFVAGLFHDLGLLLVALGLPREYSELLAACNEGVRSPLECELQVLGFAHADLSAEALEIWNLPVQIQTSVRHQIDPLRDPGAAAGVTLSQVLQAADLYVRETGASMAIFAAHPEVSGPKLEALGLGDRLSPALVEFENEFKAIRPYF